MPALEGDGALEETAALFPPQEELLQPILPPSEVTKVALRLKYQVETVIPVELDEESVTRALSPVITPKVVQTAQEAGGKEYRDCVVYCLLVCKGWFWRQAKLELWDADLHHVRAVACECIAKKIIESEEDQDYLLQHILLQRFRIRVGSAPGDLSDMTNVIERAVDLHALRVIGSSGYQKCISYLWRGWLVQHDDNPTHFIFYRDRANTSYWAHLDPDRMRVPMYQNALQIFFSLVYLGLYTAAINTINPTGDFDLIEGLLYLFTLAYVCDEASKIYKVGYHAIGFWNVFNSTLYALLAVSFIMRMIALGHLPRKGNEDREYFNQLSYNFLAFTAPMFWMRLMLYFDTFKFFGAMLIVINIMMKESLIFFALLFFILVGFFQGFIGMDLVDAKPDKTSFIVRAMTNAIMSSPEFSGFDNFAPPFGIILFYLFTFVIMVILLNILIALYNTSYEDISDNSNDEYLALFSQKCLRFVRAPDENVFIPPFNLLEILLLVVPFEWWMRKHNYERLNTMVMGLIYSPLLFMTAWHETRDASKIIWNRRRGEEDDDSVEEWEVLNWKPDAEAHANGTSAPRQGDPEWCRLVAETSPDPAKNPVLEELAAVKREVEALKGSLLSGEKSRGR